MKVLSIKATVRAALVMTAFALQPHSVSAQPLSYEKKYCLGMAGVTAGTMEMVQAGRRSWSQIQNQLVKTVRQAQWPLNQADYDSAVNMGMTGVRNGDDPRAVAQFILRECIQYAWYNR
ncbi:hypothetical protein [Sulfitobacter sp. R18_1]|uniref:hypothetical protein n=1 Tax=Sulfitobacter sp. R18_1 TaxID=2821104 RepID=UPI001AD9E0D6|nr:hypothetical protein [Sulfitobacter sp. R18_1]MBO9428086.1 hypothetical protein [Sulfitobacter sp. R18_1]